MAIVVFAEEMGSILPGLSWTHSKCNDSFWVPDIIMHEFGISPHFMDVEILRLRAG